MDIRLRNINKTAAILTKEDIDHFYNENPNAKIRSQEDISKRLAAAILGTSSLALPLAVFGLDVANHAKHRAADPNVITLFKEDLRPSLRERILRKNLPVKLGDTYARNVLKERLLPAAAFIGEAKRAWPLLGGMAGMVLLSSIPAYFEHAEIGREMDRSKDWYISRGLPYDADKASKGKDYSWYRKKLADKYIKQFKEASSIKDVIGKSAELLCSDDIEKTAFLFHNYDKDYEKLVSIDPDIKNFDKNIVVNNYLKPSRRRERAFYNKPEAYAGWLKERYTLGEEINKKHQEIPGIYDSPAARRNLVLQDLELLTKHKRAAGLMSDADYARYQEAAKQPNFGYHPEDVIAAKYVARRFTSRYPDKREEVTRGLLEAPTNTERVKLLKSLYNEKELKALTEAGYDVDKELLTYLRRHKFYDGLETPLKEASVESIIEKSATSILENMEKNGYQTL